MKAFGYITAKDVGHAVALLGEHGAKAKILAGGTDLLVELKHAVHAPEMIVDVSRLRELKEIAVKDDGLHIGALATHGDIMTFAGYPLTCFRHWSMPPIPSAPCRRAISARSAATW